jgi:hypothetical protein
MIAFRGRKSRPSFFSVEERMWSRVTRGEVNCIVFRAGVSPCEFSTVGHSTCGSGSWRPVRSRENRNGVGGLVC